MIDSLRRELEGCKNEVENLRSTKRSEIESKDRQIGLLQQTVQGMQQVQQLAFSTPIERITECLLML